jgi:hypothetical protein
MVDRSPNSSLLQDIRDQNSHLQQLIEVTASLLVRSRELLRRLRSAAGSGEDIQSRRQ